MLDRATPLLVFDRRDQEVDRHVEVLRRPALDDGAALIGLVVSEPGLAQPFGDLLVALVIEHGERETDVQIVGPAMSSFVSPSLVQ